jgi:ABC-type transport system involved in cytochrome bd biosynthesis fused ATPase/permease subunit
MFAKLPPLFQDYVDYFNDSPVMAVLIGVLVIVIGVALLRIALKLFLFFLLLLAIALVASNFIAGEEQTNRTLRKGAHEIGQQVEELADEGEEALREKYKEEK